jgi:hypothetical protein
MDGAGSPALTSSWVAELIGLLNHPMEHPANRLPTLIVVTVYRCIDVLGFKSRIEPRLGFGGLSQGFI